MAKYIADEEVSPDETQESFVHDHSQFHLVIATLADNRVLHLSLGSIGEIITHHIVQHADPRSIRATIELKVSTPMSTLSMPA